MRQHTNACTRWRRSALLAAAPPAAVPAAPCCCPTASAACDCLDAAAAAAATFAAAPAAAAAASPLEGVTGAPAAAGEGSGVMGPAQQPLPPSCSAPSAAGDASSKAEANVIGGMEEQRMPSSERRMPQRRVAQLPATARGAATHLVSPQSGPVDSATGHSTLAAGLSPQEGRAAAPACHQWSRNALL